MVPDYIYVEHLVVVQSTTGGQCRQCFRHINTMTRQSSGRHSTFIKALCAKQLNEPKYTRRNNCIILLVRIVFDHLWSYGLSGL